MAIAMVRSMVTREIFWHGTMNSCFLSSGGRKSSTRGSKVNRLRKISDYFMPFNAESIVGSQTDGIAYENEYANDEGKKAWHTRCKTGESAHQSDPTKSTIKHNQAHDTQNVARSLAGMNSLPFMEVVYNIRSWKNLSQTMRWEYTCEAALGTPPRAPWQTFLST